MLRSMDLSFVIQKDTKITYEPWHLRYVGKENAEYITKHQLTLEEYLNELNEK